MKLNRKYWLVILTGVIIILVIVVVLPSEKKDHLPKVNAITLATADSLDWRQPDSAAIPLDEHGLLIRYGRDLIVNTSKYFGPKGSVAHITNGMNCQNCHIDAGGKPYGNSFAGVASIYPTFRPRSGIVESIEFRINDCLQRSLNGKTIDSTGKEMQAMVAYLQWIGKDVPKKTKPKSAGTIELPLLNRAADTAKGALVYAKKCQSCHGANGQGLIKADMTGFVYPPLWGKRSYNTGAGLYRLTRFAGFVRYSMPFNMAETKIQLTDEEAWDVAAFVNSKPRPVKHFKQDWPDLTKKGFDYPYGPYIDSFSERQHKYGPYGPIKKAIAELQKSKTGK